MSDRPTLETDALITLRSGFGVTDYEWRQHSRKLERQRDEARELVRELLDILELTLEHAEPGIWVYSDDPKKETLLSVALASAITRAKEVLP